MIKLENVCKKFDNNILTSFSYTFANTGIYILNGPSGCGKTTFLNTYIFILLHHYF